MNPPGAQVAELVDALVSGTNYGAPWRFEVLSWGTNSFRLLMPPATILPGSGFGNSSIRVSGASRLRFSGRESLSGREFYLINILVRRLYGAAPRSASLRLMMDLGPDGRGSGGLSRLLMATRRFAVATGGGYMAAALTCRLRSPSRRGLR